MKGRVSSIVHGSQRWSGRSGSWSWSWSWELGTWDSGERWANEMGTKSGLLFGVLA